MKFKTQWDKIPTTVERNSGKSETIPDQSLSVIDLVRNHTIPNLTVSEANYHDPTGTDELAIGQESGRRLHSMDISEVHDELRAIEERELERKEQDKKDRKEKAKRLLTEEQNRTFERWKNEQNKGKTEGD